MRSLIRVLELFKLFGYRARSRVMTSHVIGAEGRTRKARDSGDAVRATEALVSHTRLMSYDSGLVARIADALLQLGERAVRQKNVFGGRGFLVGKSTFAIVFDGDLIVKVRPDGRDNALAEPGVTPFAPDGENPSRGIGAVVSGNAIADDPELSAWLRRGLQTLR